MVAAVMLSSLWVTDILVRKFKTLGMDNDKALQALLLLVKVKGRVSRGDDIVSPGSSLGYSTVLLNGFACRYKMTENGRRQIFVFHYPGDFCDLNRYVLPELDEAVAALTGCLIGVIHHEDIERITAQYPKLGLALWSDTLVEASIFRERLLNVGHLPALRRIANLLCEQMVRLEAIGMDGTIIPMTQVDLADAANLSTVHMNRTVQYLRELGVLSKNRRGIEVAHREGLVEIAKFDGRYLNIPQVLDTRQPSLPATAIGRGSWQAKTQETSARKAGRTSRMTAFDETVIP
jgi:CRP-like cAMP-binding protein